MYQHHSSLEEKISLGLTSKDFEVLKLLANDISFKVRRAVARNEFTPADILKILAYDPVVNVSFAAVKHSNCDIKRCFEDHEHPCVCCNIDELKMDCNNCKRIKDFCSA